MSKRVSIHDNLDSFAASIIANCDYFATAIHNKNKLINWYRAEREQEVARVGRMYDNLISSAELELAELGNHVEFLGLDLPDIVDGPQKENTT